MASKEDEATGPQQTKGFKAKMQGIGNYLYNPSEKTVLERTAASWGKITLFYLVFYSCLAGFWAAMLFGFFTTIEDDQPKMQKWESLIKNNPGMGFRPQPDLEYTLIDFNQGDEQTYLKYTQQLAAFLEDYSDEKQTENGLMPCDTEDPGFKNRNPAIPCKFPMSLLGTECTSQKHYGYDEGRPCVLLKMNKLFHWEPEAYGNTSIPEEVTNNYNPGFISVTCDGVTSADKDNIGEVTFFPESGFSSMYFPYTNQKNYLAPVVMVQFERLRPGTLIQVWCKVWAENIYHDRNDRAGSVNLELVMD